MDVSFVIRQRLEEFGLEQRELARAAQVTESYISQLLTRKKAPPAPGRTDIYDKMDRFLKLPSGELARLAAVQRKAELKRETGRRARPAVSGSPRVDPPQVSPRPGTARPRDLRGAAVRRARAPRHPTAAGRAHGRGQGRAGERVLAPHGRGPRRPKLRGDARHRPRVPGYRHLPPVPGAVRRVPGAADRILGHRPRDVCAGHRPEPQGGLRACETIRVHRAGTAASWPAKSPGSPNFFRIPALSGSATEEELAFLKRLRFKGKRPTPLYYYRELQNLRDPLHFRSG